MNSEFVISSFSGGRTSAYMTKILKEKHGDNLKVVFMNTGLEHEKTLDFVDRCDKEWGLEINWIEAVVNHKEKVATGFRYVTFETATNGNSIAVEVVKKYGLFGVGYLHCTREMKLRPFKAWKIQNGLIEAKTAIGIRSDEMDRVNPKYEKENLFYPLLNMGITKGDIEQFWSEQSFKLDLPERYGNCKMCWKKSEKKLIANLRNNPSWSKDVRELESLGTKGADKMFRKDRNIDDLSIIANSNIEMFDSVDSGCKESCELF